jgi:hypothetical protein
MNKLEIENEKNNFLKNININKNNKFYILKIITLKKLIKLHNIKYIIITILIIYFSLTFNFFNNDHHQFKSKKYDGEIIYKNKRQNYLKGEIINKFNFYIKICNKDKLINKKRYPLLNFTIY